MSLYKQDAASGGKNIFCCTHCAGTGTASGKTVTTTDVIICRLDCLIRMRLLEIQIAATSNTLSLSYIVFLVPGNQQLVHGHRNSNLYLNMSVTISM